MHLHPCIESTLAIFVSHPFVDSVPFLLGAFEGIWARRWTPTQSSPIVLGQFSASCRYIRPTARHSAVISNQKNVSLDTAAQESGWHAACACICRVTCAMCLTCFFMLIISCACFMARVRGPQHRFLRTADFGGSQKAMLEPLGSCRGACVSCMHHSACHDRCTCSMACRARAYGPRARSVSAPSPAWQRPARWHRSRLGRPLCMHSFPHAAA